MVILRGFIFFFSIWASLQTHAEYRLICFPENKCSDVLEKANKMKIEKSTDFSIVKSIGLDNSVKFLRTIKRKTGQTLLIVEKKPVVRTLTFTGPDDVEIDQIQKMTQIQEGTYFSEEEFQSAKERVEAWLFDKGFLNPLFLYKTSIKSKGDIGVQVSISYEKKLILKEIKLIGDSNSLTNELIVSIQKLKGKPFSKVNFKLAVDNLIAELKREGYLAAEIRLKQSVKDDKVSIEVKLSLGRRLQFSFFGNKILNKELLTLSIKKSIQEGTSILRSSDLRSVVENSYVQRGIYNSQVKLYIRESKTKEGNEVTTYFFNIIEGEKIRLAKLLFKGNLAVDLEELKRIYYEQSTVLAGRDYLDEGYLKNFTSILKNFYLKNGYVFIEISKPRLVINKERNEAEVTYSLKERQQSILEKINLDGIDGYYKETILKSMVNKIGRPMNVIELESDLSRALNKLRDIGFFYARITNLNDDNVVSYDSNFTKSSLNLKFKTGKITKLENVVLSGNKVTKDVVVLREVKIQKGDVITPERIKGIRDRINALGLFGKIQVLPLVTNKLTTDDFNKTNLIIQVQEKKFGRGEIAPGYRTDIGAKLSFTLSKTNLMGMNDSGTLKLQLNRRFSLSQFDARRAAQRSQKIEGIASVNYSYPYLLNLANFGGSFSVQRRRFFSFDADIFRISPQLTKQINSFLGLSVKYQYERIRQFDATEEKDRATFEIGSITPGITLDFRDSPVSPRSGAYFGLNWEFANRYFGSQKDSNIEINFSKVISRNRFYMPLGSKNFVLAFSMAAGMQENYANDISGLNSDGSNRTSGYIPSIKVFRLDGFDTVRGYADNEINRLENGEDVTRTRLQGKAFFANLKFEPRYYVNDTFVLGPFFDAGRITVDTFTPTDLRTSAGLTLKFLTPVGTLDFDYGIKLRRRSFNNGNRESFGRFHLSIGYF